MISRLRRAFALLAVPFCVALLTAACQKVPLLAPSGSTITLTSLATALPINGSTDLIAQVIEASGTPPHSGTLVTFTTNLGTIQPSEAETDISGRVAVKYLASAGSGTATITAISGGVSASGTNAIKIAVGAAAIGKVTADASPSVIPASGGSSTITATAFDVNGNLLVAVPVSFTTDVGAMSPAVVSTDANGKAQSILTTTKAATVTASAGLSTAGTGAGTGTTPATNPQTAVVKVNVNVAPSITVGAPSPAAPTVGQSVTFALTYGTDANSSPVQNVTVDFGDGSKATVFSGKPASVSHTYNAIGSYSMRATVVDSQGDTSSASSSVSVGALGTVTVGAPTPALPTVGQAASFPLTFTDPANTIQRVNVDYGDGTAAVSYAGKPTSVNHTYARGGTFAIRVTAFDAFGNTSVGGTSVLISAKAQPTVLISTTGTPTAGTDITFLATVTAAALNGTNIASVSVDFGDNTTPTNLGAVSGTGIAIHHVYATSSTYTVTLTATDTNGGVGTATTTVFVQAAPPLGVTVSFTKTNIDNLNAQVVFTATVTGLGNAVVNSYQWNFGDGTTTTTTTNQVTHNYARPSSPPTLVGTATITTSNGGTASGSTSSITP